MPLSGFENLDRSVDESMPSTRIEWRCNKFLSRSFPIVLPSRRAAAVHHLLILARISNVSTKRQTQKFGLMVASIVTQCFENTGRWRGGGIVLMLVDLWFEEACAWKLKEILMRKCGGNVKCWGNVGQIWPRIRSSGSKDRKCQAAV